MDKIKYIFFDLDGTLLTDKKEISRRQLDFLRKLKCDTGIRLGVATGRAWTAVAPLDERYALTEIMDFFVLDNGANLYNARTGKFRENEFLTVEQLRRIVDVFSPFPYLTTGFHNPRGFFATGEGTGTERILKNNRLSKVYSPFREEFAPAPRAMLMFDKKDRSCVEEAVKANPIEGVRFTFSEPDLCEILREEVSKARGIRLAIAGTGGKLSEVMVFGNSDNDLEMIETCGVSAAVKNATELILEKADYVCPGTNNEDGVTEFLKLHRQELLPEKERRSQYE